MSAAPLEPGCVSVLLRVVRRVLVRRVLVLRVLVLRVLVLRDDRERM